MIVNSFPPDQHHSLALIYFQIVYFHLQSPPRENGSMQTRVCAYFSRGQYFSQTLLPSPLASFHPTRLPKPCYKDGSFLCCLQGAVCQRDHHWPPHCFNNHGCGRRYGGNMWASASVAHSSLCPFTCALSLHGPDSFLFFKLLNSVK